VANELKITLVRSTIGSLPNQRQTVKALGLRKIGQSVIKKDNDAMRGMAKKVSHLVKLEEI
jgi:large subunit ribosomal protein L30